MCLVFNKVSFNIGLLDEAKTAKDEDLLVFRPEKIDCLADALSSLRFSENYPKEDLQDCLDLREEIDFVRVEKTDEQLWIEIYDEHIVPAGRRLAKFTINCGELIGVRSFDQRKAWQKLIDALAGWERTPHLPNVYAELIPTQ